MRILIAHSRYRSGPASGENRVVEDEATLLRQAGHDVTVWDPTVEASTLVDRAKAGMRLVWSRQAETTIRDIVRRERPDVVHCHNLFPALSPAVLAAAGEHGSRVVVTLHNYRLLCLPGTFTRNGHVCEDCLGRLPVPGVVHGCYQGSVVASAALATSLATHRALGTFRRPDLYLAVSEFVREKYLAAGWSASCLRVKSNFAWPGLRRQGAGQYFLYIGRLAPEKGAATLMRAWREVKSSLIVVGDGPEAPALQASAPPNVEFRGQVPPSAVRSLLEHARALLVPSICYEAQPRSILEAYASAVPVVASRVGALPEVVREGESGLLLPATDPAAWAAAATYLSDDQRSLALGEGAWALWQERYTPERGIDGLESCYQEALVARAASATSRQEER